MLGGSGDNGGFNKCKGATNPSAETFTSAVEKVSVILCEVFFADVAFFISCVAPSF
jgi:hypothetical protein